MKTGAAFGAGFPYIPLTLHIFASAMAGAFYESGSDDPRRRAVQILPGLFIKIAPAQAGAGRSDGKEGPGRITRGLKTLHWSVFAGCGPHALFKSDWPFIKIAPAQAGGGAF